MKKKEKKILPVSIKTEIKFIRGISIMKSANIKVGIFKGFKVNEKNVQVGIEVGKASIFGEASDIQVLSFFKDDTTTDLQTAIKAYEVDTQIAVDFTYNASASQSGKAFLNVNLVKLYTPEECAAFSAILK